MVGTDDTRMTNSEHRRFLRLLRRWCETELDQFEHLIVPTRDGDVYVTMGRYPATEHPNDLYTRVPEAWFGEDAG
ncbi:hypothetical protein DFR70_1072 [Nocardia tenerifensis]|uniref:Uncharacterized protein n=1 Tax=Nocardia tenerifensis TaxID=228006 RepID=A0A318JYE9_9NOCA|nr:hypothetical protein DFR70_1072 [Nocardia tenerifensis]